MVRNIQTLVDKYYDKLFDELVKIESGSFYEIIVEVKESTTGLTVRRSWKDREKMLSEENRTFNEAN